VKQLILDVSLPVYANFDTFIANGNEIIVAKFKEIAMRPDMGRTVYLSGPQASGKTHLLHAACHKANENGVNEDHASLFLNLAQAGLQPGILYGWDHVQMICLDNLDAVLESKLWQGRV